jgi:hypothetical protein
MRLALKHIAAERVIPGRHAATQRLCVQCTIILDSRPKEASIHKIVIVGQRMRHKAASIASSLPSLMMPCPVCAGRMVYHGLRPVSSDVEDTVYACRSCGAELIRTAMRKTVKAEAGNVRPAEAA